MATEKKKWRHHYVQQHYLKAWVGSDKKLWYEEDGMRRQATTKTIAFTRDFYRLQDARAIGATTEPYVASERGAWPSRQRFTSAA